VAGIVHKAFCLRTWNFSGLVTGAVNYEEYCILKNFPVEGYREGTLLVRVHSRTMSVGTSSIVVRAVETAPSAEEPDVDYEGTELASVSVSTGTDPELVTADFSTPFGGAVTIYVKGIQGGSAGDPVTAALSVDLVLKE
jgi:hypothetical protein